MTGRRRDGGRSPGRERGVPPAAFAGDLLARLGRDPRTATFVRGLSVGALVGAAIAGSTLWGRLRRSR
ncbi:MAG TPA: hypothetical protein VF763_01760 [Candidatus Limnocylindrales bacterium]